MAKIIIRAAPKVGTKENALGKGVCSLKNKIEYTISVMPAKLNALFNHLLEIIKLLLQVKNKILPNKSSQALVGNKKKAASRLKRSLSGAE